MRARGPAGEIENNGAHSVSVTLEFSVSTGCELVCGCRDAILEQHTVVPTDGAGIQIEDERP
jgi:hypothetical protein